MRADVLAHQIAEWARGAVEVEMRSAGGCGVGIYARPFVADAATIEVFLSPPDLHLFVADVLNAEPGADGGAESLRIIRAVILGGCRVRRVGWKTMFEAGPAGDDGRVIREWAPWVSGEVGDVDTVRERIQRRWN